MKLKIRYILLSFILLLITSGLLIYTSTSQQFIKESIQVQILENLFKPLDFIYFHLAFAKNNLPVYEIETSNKNIQRLYDSLPMTQDSKAVEYKRFVEDRIYIPARVTIDKNNYKADITVRGASPPHFLGEKKSFRIRIDKDEEKAPFSGLDLLVVEDRYFIDEIISYSLSQRLNLLDFKPGFAWLVLNGKNMGVYQTLPDEEDNSNIELATISTNDILYRDEVKPQVISGGEWPDVFSEGASWQVRNSPEDNDPAAFTAIEKLKETNKLRGNEFFEKLPSILDVEQYLRYAAHNTIMGDWHQESFHNQSLVFLKEKGQFWFIPNDNSTNPIETLQGRHFSNLREKMMKNPNYFWGRNRYMWEIVNDDEYKKQLTNEIDQTYNLIKGPIYQDQLRPFRFIAFKSKVNSLRNTIFKNFDTVKEYYKDSYIESSFKNNSGLQTDNIAIIKIIARSYFQPVVKSIKIVFKTSTQTTLSLYWDKNENENLDEGEPFIKEFPINNIKNAELSIDIPLASQRFIDNPIDRIRPAAVSQIIVKSTNKNVPIETAEVIFSNSLTGGTIESQTNMVDGSFFVEPSNIPSFVKQPTEGKFEIGPGHFTLENDLFIPQGELTIKPGTTISLNPGVSIISKAKVIAKGSEDKPIVLTKAKEQNWGSFLVVDADGTNEFNYVTIEYGSGIKNYGYIATGALAVHFSNIIVSNSYFSNNGDDDGLNIKHGTGKIQNSRFASNIQDAIDLDAFDGEILNNQFSQNGGDSIDTSFSKAKIEGNIVNKSGDKCISVGEQSNLEINKNTLENCDIGIAVKDGSFATATENQIRGNRIALSGYVKKYYFKAGGTIQLKGNIIENNQITEEFDKDSKIIGI